MKVFVVMGNDYPDAVFKKERKAEEYCQSKRRAHLDAGSTGMRIHWRVYEFELR